MKLLSTCCSEMRTSFRPRPLAAATAAAVRRRSCCCRRCRFDFFVVDQIAILVLRGFFIVTSAVCINSSATTTIEAAGRSLGWAFLSDAAAAAMPSADKADGTAAAPLRFCSFARRFLAAASLVLAAVIACHAFGRRGRRELCRDGGDARRHARRRGASGGWWAPAWTTVRSRHRAVATTVCRPRPVTLTNSGIFGKEAEEQQQQQQQQQQQPASASGGEFCDRRRGSTHRSRFARGATSCNAQRTTSWTTWSCSSAIVVVAIRCCSKRKPQRQTRHSGSG